MGIPYKSREMNTWLRLETVIILGLSLKLILTAAFILIYDTPSEMPLQPKPVHAQDKVPEKAKDADPSKDTASTPVRTAQAAPRKGNYDAREQALNQRERQLNEKAKALKALETQIQGRLAEIEDTRKKLAELVKRHEALVQEQKLIRDARLEHLVTAYKGMRPELAAKLVDSLEDDVAVDILAAMPGRSAGQILAQVNPQKAARLTKAISLRRNKPSDAAPVTPQKPVEEPATQKEKPEKKAAPTGFPQPPKKK